MNQNKKVIGEKPVGNFTIDTLITTVAGMLQLVLGVGVSIVIARILGPQLKGIYSLVILLPALLLPFGIGTLGIGQASIFYLGKRKYPKETILGTNIVLSFCTGTIGFLIGWIIIALVGSSMFPGVEKDYLILALFLIPFQIFFSTLNDFLLGVQKIKEFNFVAILQVFVFFILLLILLAGFKLGIKAAVSAYILSHFIGIIISFYIIKRELSYFHWHFNKSYAKDALTFGFKVYMGNAIGLLRYRINIFLINIFLNPTAVGLYSIAGEITERIWLISQSAGLILFPRISAEKDEKRLKEFTPVLCRNVLLITSIGAFFLFLVGKVLVVLFYSEKFLASVLPLRILLIGTVTMSGVKVLSNDLYGRKKPELNIYINSATVIINIILNILWIPGYGITGAACATSVSYTLAFIIMTFVYGKISGNRLYDIIIPKREDFRIYENLILRACRK